MTKKTRNMLFILFVALFCLITPVAFLYTAGYKISFSWPPNLNTALQKTGMLVVETEPRGARVLIDGKNPGSALKRIFTKTKTYTTPLKIQGLIPEEYDVELQMDGYWEWNRKINIHPGQITQLKDVKLFKKDLPIKIFDSASQDIKISPNESSAAIIENKILVIVDLKNETKKTFELGDAYGGDNFILWSPNSKKIIANNILIELESEKLIDLSRVIGQELKNIKWSQTDDKKLFYEYGGEIRQFDINYLVSLKILEDAKCLDYIQKQDAMIIVSQRSGVSRIQNFSLKDKKTIREFELPYSSGYKLQKNENNLIHLYDEKIKILYLLNMESHFNPLEDVINNLDQYQWISQNLMLYKNDFELWLYNSETKEKNLITRISEKIQSAFWHPRGKHIVYSTESGIFIIELEKQDRRHITELLNFEKIIFLKINNNGDIIYFWAKIGNQEGLYKLKI